MGWVRYRKPAAVWMVLLLALLLLSGCGAGGSEKVSTGTETPNAGSTDTGQAQADNFPERPVNLIVPFTAGSGADVFARTLAKAAEKHLGQQIVVENKPGGSGAIAISYVLSQPADGYTIATHSRTLSLLLAGGEVPFGVDDLDYIIRVNGESSSLMVPKDSPFQTLEDFIRYAKERPGELKVGGPGTGSFHHMVAMEFRSMAGIDFTWVPFEGGKEAVLAALGGHVDAVQATASNGKASIDSGDLRILASTSEERSEFLPDVPTYKEGGVDLVEILWRGVVTKAGVPEERIARLEEAFRKAMEEPEWEKYMADFAQEKAYLNSADFSDYIRKEVANTKTFLDQLKAENEK